MENINTHLTSLRLNADNNASHHKKSGPAVPSKPKQPVVPKSYAISGPCEPSYTRPLQIEKKSSVRAPIYSNIIPTTQIDQSGIRNTSNNDVTSGYSNIHHVSKVAPHVYSNINTYSNLPPYDHHDLLDDLPPPPPEPVDYGSSTYPQPPEEFPSPPSPLSSSYSELRRAAEFHSQPFQQDYGNYGTSSRGSSTYESIYEPINLRPSSEISSRSNYSLYGSASVTGGGGSDGSVSTQPHQEDEVDTLTDLLINSMDSTIPDPDTFGECCKCGKKVVGEGNGCTAMGKVYHISCFTCCHCHTRLEGKPFYYLDGDPYCEQGYLETLEKCSVCFKPILDRILRATGRPYHPHCFTCVVCGKNLDGITFTIDATNQIHCIEDFHRKFAPRCCVCKQPIMPEPGEEETVRIVALDRSFHTGCYKCEDCSLVLSTEAEGRGCYPLDDHILCKSCNAKRVQALTSVMTTEL